jgi:hypothetical protein
MRDPELWVRVVVGQKWGVPVVMVGCRLQHPAYTASEKTVAVRAFWVARRVIGVLVGCDDGQDTGVSMIVCSKGGEMAARTLRLDGSRWQLTNRKGKTRSRMGTADDRTAW